jgi:hypothetical protein
MISIRRDIFPYDLIMNIMGAVSLRGLTVNIGLATEFSSDSDNPSPLLTMSLDFDYWCPFDVFLRSVLALDSEELGPDTLSTFH